MLRSILAVIVIAALAPAATSFADQPIANFVLTDLGGVRMTYGRSSVTSLPLPLRAGVRTQVLSRGSCPARILRCGDRNQAAQIEIDGGTSAWVAGNVWFRTGNCTIHRWDVFYGEVYLPYAVVIYGDGTCVCCIDPPDDGRIVWDR